MIAIEIKKSPNKYVYPALFTVGETHISIVFPDFEALVYTCHGREIDDAIKQAKEALGFHLCKLEQEEREIPVPRSITELNTGPNQCVFMVEVWMPLYRNTLKNKTVKVTVSLPAWLNELVIQKKVDCSFIFETALKKHLGIEEMQLEEGEVAIEKNTNQTAHSGTDPNDIRSLTVCWEKIINEIASFLSTSSFETWIKPTKLTAIDTENRILYVEVENEFSKEWLESRYGPLLTTTAKEIFADDYSIQFYTNKK